MASPSNVHFPFTFPFRTAMSNRSSKGSRTPKTALPAVRPFPFAFAFAFTFPLPALVTLLLLLAQFAPVRATDFTSEDIAALQTATQHVIDHATPTLVPVGRLGRVEMTTAAWIDESGLLLATRIPAVSKLKTPYWLEGQSGVRLEAKPIWEDEDTGLALLQLEAPITASALRKEDSEPVVATPTQSNTWADVGWLARPAVSPALIPGEPIQWHLEPLLETSDKPTAPLWFTSAAWRTGTLLFDLRGHLVGFLSKSKDDAIEARVTPLAALRTKHAAIATFLERKPANGSDIDLDDIPHTLPARRSKRKKSKSSDKDERPHHPVARALEALATETLTPPSPLDEDKARPPIDAALVSILEQGKSDTAGIHGIIVSPDGQILTKASAIGANPIVTHNDTDYPATLLAIDEPTDLALLHIAATNLPTITWPLPPQGPILLPGTWVFSPLRLTSPPHNDPMAVGFISHLLPEHAASPATLHQPEAVTSLGILPHQADGDLLIAAIFPDGPAATTDLRRGDRLDAIDDQPTSTRADLRDILKDRKVGDTVTLRVLRGDETKTIDLTLGPARLLPARTGETQQTLSMIPSVWRAGFPETWVHNLPLNAWQCGTPLFNFEGQFLGINIAATSPQRVLTLPAPTVLAGLKRLRATSISF